MLECCGGGQDFFIVEGHRLGLLALEQVLLVFVMRRAGMGRGAEGIDRFDNGEAISGIAHQTELGVAGGDLSQPFPVGFGIGGSEHIG